MLPSLIAGVKALATAVAFGRDEFDGKDTAALVTTLPAAKDSTLAARASAVAGEDCREAST